MRVPQQNPLNKRDFDIEIALFFAAQLALVAQLLRHKSGNSL
jgi:hypothetical protein